MLSSANKVRHAKNVRNFLQEPTTSVSNMTKKITDPNMTKKGNVTRWGGLLPKVRVGARRTTDGAAFLLDDETKIGKFLFYSTAQEKMDIVREFEIGKKMGELGIGPRVFRYYIVKTPTTPQVSSNLLRNRRAPGKMAVYIIMQNLAHGASKLQSLFEYVKEGNPYPEKKIRVLMARMRKAGVLHGDLHSENILVKTFAGSRYFRVYFIDYGRSIYVPANKNVRTHLIQKGYTNMTANKFPGYFESPTTGVPRSVNQTILNRNAKALMFNRTKLRRRQ